VASPSAATSSTPTRSPSAAPSPAVARCPCRPPGVHVLATTSAGIGRPSTRSRPGPPLGDLQYERGEYANFLRAYDLSWGRFKDRTRPAVGNHEYIDPASHPRRCTLAFFHHPYRSSAAPYTGKTELRHLWALLVAGGVDLVLNGHNHAYERLKPMRTTGDVGVDGAPWTVVAGTGGRSLIPFSSVHRNSSARARVYGVHKMVLYPDRWVGALKATDGTTRDLRSIGCH
jgi:hypothetical protein